MGRGFPGFPLGGRSLRAAAVGRRPTDEVESYRLQTLLSVLLDFFDTLTRPGRLPGAVFCVCPEAPPERPEKTFSFFQNNT